MKKSIFIILLVISQLSFAQNNKQNIRGIVTDKLSQTTLPGASVQIINKTENKGTTSDVNGNYVLTDISPDRYEIKISFIGYKNVIVPDVIVVSGKETILDIAMEENITNLNEVVVSANSKDKTINNLTSISARTFSMEEVNRYSGGRSDAARLVANFAGVSAPDDSRNDIVIRGNSPVGVLWRINGMNVTNPNHFASVGTTGGAVSALNTNMLKSSDFLTSAFPSEYGNATAGVFDIGFRNGNSQKRESSLQFGLITGLEAMTEGPISKKNNSSYLIGYRYSLTGIANALGIDYGTTAIPTYQDLSFNINSGNSKLGKFTLFGILATSSISISNGNDGSMYGGRDGHDLSSTIGIIGLNHFIQINNKSYLSTTIGLNYSKTDQTDYSFDRLTSTNFTREENNVSKTGYNFSTSYNSKISSRLFVKVGIQDEFIRLSLYYRMKERIVDNWKQIWDYNSYTNLAQAYLHAKYSFSEKFTLNAGVHAQFFFLNNSISFEPRLGLKYAINNKNSFNFGYGLHSQTQPINVYFLQSQDTNGTYSYNNKDLNFTKSHHFVLGYDLQAFENWRLKAEVYYQYLFNVPVNTYSSSYSMLNTGAGFKTDLEDSLTNEGTGTNYGVELTIEKFFSKGYYALFTFSLYSSKYKGSDGIERNTAFNGRYVYNILGGKEWKVGKDRRNKICIDLKLTNAGGRAYTPIDLTASETVGHGVYSTDVFSDYYSTYFRMDFKVGFTLNSRRKKISNSISIDLQNITNNKNVFSQEYDDRSRSIKSTYQLGFFPNFIYKLQF